MERNQATNDDVQRASTRAPSPSPAAGNPMKERLLGDVANRFTYHAPAADQIPRYQELRNIGKELALSIVEFTPVSREQALALTHLEQAIMWANAAISRNE